MTVELPQQKTERGTARIRLAQRLLAQLERLPTKLGDVSLGVELQLLKRELSRGHQVLRDCPRENAFLSVITLVEAALASLTWKQYTPQIVDAVRQAFTAGTRPGAFTSQDYDAIRRSFNAQRLPTSPMIDLTAPFVDDENGPE
jgi:hypothetical protein